MLVATTLWGVYYVAIEKQYRRWCLHKPLPHGTLALEWAEVGKVVRGLLEAEERVTLVI